VVLPFYHTGMAAVMPYRARFPRFGHNVTVTFGEPVELDDVTCDCNKAGCDQQQVWQEITARIRTSLLVRTLTAVPLAEMVAHVCVQYCAAFARDLKCLPALRENTTLVVHTCNSQPGCRTWKSGA
jgi:pyruvate-formate lyase-activating enzyme